jgi:uncharacterized membrane protein YqaE (UPF0057 family)
VARPSGGAIVAAVLLPPLGVYLARGIGADFWIAAGLTLVGWLPGVAYALFVLFRPSAPARA